MYTEDAKANRPPVALEAPSRHEIEAARERIAGFAVRTPLVRLNHGGPREIYLKLEQLQPIGSFKIRCAANALLSQHDAARTEGVVTASAGNFAQGLGYAARRLWIPVTSLVPETAAHSKIQALERLGVKIERRPYEQWWNVLEHPADHGFGDRFIHPCACAPVLAGNATIGLEILEELEPEEVIVPYGGGGLVAGIAVAMKMHRPAIRILAAESEAGTPLAAAFAAGKPVPTAFDSTTFITGMGSPQVIAPIWPLVRTWVDGAISTSLRSVAAAIRLLIERHHVIAEGAGAVTVASALERPSTGGPIVCVVSGGHLDTAHLLRILSGEL